MGALDHAFDSVFWVMCLGLSVLWGDVSNNIDFDLVVQATSGCIESRIQ